MTSPNQEQVRREFAGLLVRELLGRYRSIEQAAQDFGIVRSTLYAVMDGAAHVKQFTYNRVNVGLGLPSGLLWAIVQGDRAMIETVEFDPNLKRRILAVIDPPTPPASGRRSRSH
ncbi:MAG: hypothetical protein JOY61_24410 [Chloroflexi bacterium]|nr:hypothetical protein [Chloroflexota bacterium]